MYQLESRERAKRDYLQVYYSIISCNLTMNFTAKRHSSDYELQVPHSSEETEVWRRLATCRLLCERIGTWSQDLGFGV